MSSFKALIRANLQIITILIAYASSFWDPAEIVPDWYELPIPPDASPGDYAIALGLYRLTDGTRLPVAGLGDKVLLPIRVQVKFPKN